VHGTNKKFVQNFDWKTPKEIEALLLKIPEHEYVVEVLCGTSTELVTVMTLGSMILSVLAT
jgi:hypothetical protein